MEKGLVVSDWIILPTFFGPLGFCAVDGCLVQTCIGQTSPQLKSLFQSKYGDATGTEMGLLREATAQTLAYCEGRITGFDLPLDLTGRSTFFTKVIQALLEVRGGAVISYGQLASEAGSSGASRAVGSIMRNNPWPLIVPCHRVIGQGGRLGKYSAGEGDRTKAALLTFEGMMINDDRIVLDRLKHDS